MSIRHVPRLIALSVALAFSGGGMAAPATGTLPTNPLVSNGTASFANPAPGQLVVTNSPGAIINWQSFSIGSGAGVRFDQASAASAVLNRVGSGSAPSEIYGRLDSNGRVFLVNPNGIVFGGSAIVDVQGLVASTLNLSDTDFLAGNYRFQGGSGALTLQNGARIVTSNRGPNGQVWLVAGGRLLTEQGSRIDTAVGQAVLAAGSSLQVTDDATGGMRFTLATTAANSLEHYGEIAAQRGAIGMFADSIVHAGASSVTVPDGSPHGGFGATPGSIQMVAARDVVVRNDSLINTSGGQTTAGGSIRIEAGNRLLVEGRAEIAADGGSFGTAAGRIDLIGNEVLVEPGLTGTPGVHATATNANANGSVTITRRAAPAGAVSAYIPVSTTGGADHLPAVTFLADGSYVVVWLEMVPPAGSGIIWSTVYATTWGRHFNADGTPRGSPFQVAQSTGYQYSPAVAPLADGGFLVLWSYEPRRPDPNVIAAWGDYSNFIYARRYNAAGAPQGGEFAVSNTPYASDVQYSLTDPVVTSLAGGNFLVSWSSSASRKVTSGGTTTYPTVEAGHVESRRFDASGVAQTGVFLPFTLTDLAATNAAGFGAPILPRVVPYGDGGFALVYLRGRQSVVSGVTTEERQQYIQRFTADGARIGSETALAAPLLAPVTVSAGYTPVNFYVDSATTLANGDLLVTHRVRSCSTCDNKAYFSVYDSKGAVRIQDRPLALDGANIYVRGAALADGGFAIVWEHTDATVSAQSPAGYGYKDNDSLAQRFDAQGNPLGGQINLSEYNPQGLPGVLGGTDQPRIATGADGAFVAVFGDNLNISGSQYYTAPEIRSVLTRPGTVAGSALAPAAGVLPGNPNFLTRPGRANGAYEPPRAAPAPVAPPVVVLPEPPAGPKARPAGDKTESVHNDIRLVTPTGRDDFVFPGAAEHFGGTLQVVAVRGQNNEIVGYAVHGPRPSGRDDRRDEHRQDGRDDRLEDRRDDR